MLRQAEVDAAADGLTNVAFERADALRPHEHLDGVTLTGAAWLVTAHRL